MTTSALARCARAAASHMHSCSNFWCGGSSSHASEPRFGIAASSSFIVFAVTASDWRLLGMRPPRRRVSAMRKLARGASASAS